MDIYLEESETRVEVDLSSVGSPEKFLISCIELPVVGRPHGIHSGSVAAAHSAAYLFGFLLPSLRLGRSFLYVRLDFFVLCRKKKRTSERESDQTPQHRNNTPRCLTSLTPPLLTCRSRIGRFLSPSVRRQQWARNLYFTHTRYRCRLYSLH